MNKITSEDKLIKECLLKSRHIALIGASVRQELAAYEVMKYLLENDYKVFPVNPKYKGESILGQKVYADLLDIPTSIDLVNVFRPAAEAIVITQKAIEAKATYVWLQLAIENQDAKKIAEENGIIMIMNRCTLIEHKKMF